MGGEGQAPPNILALSRPWLKQVGAVLTAAEGRNAAATCRIRLEISTACRIFRVYNGPRGVSPQISCGSKIFARGVRQLVPLECPKPLHVPPTRKKISWELAAR